MAKGFGAVVTGDDNDNNDDNDNDDDTTQFTSRIQWCSKKIPFCDFLLIDTLRK